MVITAECVEGSVGHCANTPTYVEPDVCGPWPGYVQVSYDKCCEFAGSTNCNDFTAPPTPSPTAAAAGTNLVQNPSFDDGTTGWSRRGGGVTIALDATEKHSGSQSLLVTNRNSRWKGMQKNMLGDLVAGSTYKIACWAKLNGEGSGAGFALGFQIKDDNGTRYPQVRGTISSEDWTKVEGEVTIAVTGTLTKLRLYTGGLDSGVEYWVDDFSVVSVSPETMFSEIA